MKEVDQTERKRHIESEKDMEMKIKTTKGSLGQTSGSFSTEWSGPSAWDFMLCHCRTRVSASFASILSPSTGDFSDRGKSVSTQVE